MRSSRSLGRSASVRTYVLLIILLVFFAAPESDAQVYNASVEELATASTSVVLGTTTNLRSFWNEDRSRIMTEVTLRVDEQVAGDSAPETVITIPGGRVGNAMYEVSDMPVFVEGEEVVVFLWQDASGRNLVTGGAQGRLGISVDERSNQRVIQMAGPQAPQVKQLQQADAPVDDAMAAPLEKVPVELLVKRIRDARER